MERRFRSSDWMIIGAAALLLVASVLPWWRLRFDETLDISLDAYDFRLTGTVPVTAMVVIAVLFVMIRTESLALPTWLVHPYLVTAEVAFVTILIGVRFVDNGFEDSDGVSRGLGLYLALLAVLIAIAGCVTAIRDLRRAGDELSDEDAPADSEDAAGQYGYRDDQDDDLAGRYNAALSTSEVPVVRPVEPARRPRPETADREPSPRRRGHRPTEVAPVARTRRRPRGTPPP